jgi:RNA polymerase sigma factor (sigma-70 family)
MKNARSSVAAFFRERKGALLHYIRSRIAPNGFRDAEDLLNDAITGVLSSGEIEAVGEISAYLFRSVKNRIIDLYRRGNKVESLDDIVDRSGDAALVSGEESIHDALERKELREAIFDAVDRLTPAERAIWIATELEGRAFQECAVQWDEPIGTLLSRKSRAAKKLRIMLEEYRPGVEGNPELS